MREEVSPSSSPNGEISRGESETRALLPSLDIRLLKHALCVDWALVDFNFADVSVRRRIMSWTILWRKSCIRLTDKTQRNDLFESKDTGRD
jgi:hypothetical protein